MVRLLLLCLILSNSCIAGIADLSVHLEFNQVNGVVYEQQGSFVARITNNGPDTAGLNAGLPNPISLSSGIIQDNGSFTPNIQFAPSSENNNQECFFLLTIGEPPPGGSVSYGYSINVLPIEPGQTVECFGIFSRHFVSGTREVNWNIYNTFDTDPIAENNTQSVVFGVPPQSVPVGGLWFLLTLILLMLLLGRKSLKLVTPIK